MAKIGSANIALLRPEFEESNKLLTEGLKGMWEAADPLKTAIDGNINYLQEERVGQLKNMLQGILPQNPSDPMAMQEYMQQATSLAQDNGFNKWGINAAGVFDTATALVDKNLEVNKLQGANTKANLENDKTVETNQFVQGVNAIRANGGTNDDIMKFAAVSGFSVDAAKHILDGQQQAVNIAGTVQKSNTDLIASQNALEQLNAAITANNGVATAQQRQERSYLMEVIKRMESNLSGGGVGKSQGVSSGSTGTTNSSFRDRLVQSESSGNSEASITIKDGRQFGGLLQLGAARLKDYANATKTKAMTPEQFRKLSASEQEKVNDWHINSLTKAARNTGAIGKVIKGIPMTEDALVSMAHLGGIGGMQKFIQTNGAYDPSDELGTSLSSYARKFGGGSSSGSGGGGGGSNFNISEIIGQLQLGSGMPNTTANTNELLKVLRDRIDATNTLNKSSPRIDLDSAALPSFIGKGTGSASDAMKLFEPQNQFMKDDAIASMGAITSSNQAQIADIEASEDMLKYNSSIETEFDTRLREAQEAAAANGGGNIPISALIGGEKDRLESGKAALIQAGYTPEVLATLPAETKTIIFRSLNKYLDNVDSNQNTNSLQVQKEQQGAIGNLEEFPDNYKTATVNFLNDGIKKEAVDWLEEETTFDAAMKWGARHGTLGVLGAVSDIGVSAKQRISNLDSLHTYMVDKAVSTLMSKKDRYGTSVNPRDVAGIVKRAKEIYKEMQNMDDVHNLKDLDGYMKKPMNPGKFNAAVLKAADEVSVEKNRKWGKLNDTPISIPFSEIVKKDLRDNTVNSFSKDPNK